MRAMPPAPSRSCGCLDGIPAVLRRRFWEPHDSPTHVSCVFSHQLQIVALLRRSPALQETDPKHSPFLHATNHGPPGILVEHDHSRTLVNQRTQIDHLLFHCLLPISCCSLNAMLRMQSYKNYLLSCFTLRCLFLVVLLEKNAKCTAFNRLPLQGTSSTNNSIISWIDCFFLYPVWIFLIDFPKRQIRDQATSCGSNL